uniref:Uncharacterized protein n=1 Tax=Tanacetum cinerariifolium TaxID=118510 RepID=A0A699JYV4_TANCI|nr:hypothetical protein [Tanacetum cinerariifolium]
MSVLLIEKKLRKKLRTRCSSQAPELHFVAENARVNNVKPEGCLFETPSKSWRMQNKPMNSKASSKEGKATEMKCDAAKTMTAAF